MNGWVELGRCEAGEGRPPVAETVAGWLRERGIDAAGVTADDVLVQPLCGREADGRRSRECRVLVRRTVLGAGE
ncbi:hypothetical protein Kpho02_61640 [Kitasatospora phosalacinea]|uniref:Uncharacterized protein n=1 Tax=Kitasatospora phosalacinea TaxID=2065 RepID=A0A9W6QF77_9ACTN|nr:hypothetical protein [Kitasatospora phosalacinea]GLW73866.1 hypothetical protein Kpho02_61640 [Kitasatospora phosalacinea]